MQLGAGVLLELVRLDKGRFHHHIGNQGLAFRCGMSILVEMQPATALFYLLAECLERVHVRNLIRLAECTHALNRGGPAKSLVSPERRDQKKV